MLGVLYNHPYVGNETHRTDAEHHLVPVLDTPAILYSPFLSSLQSVSPNHHYSTCSEYTIRSSPEKKHTCNGPCEDCLYIPHVPRVPWGHKHTKLHAEGHNGPHYCALSHPPPLFLSVPSPLFFSPFSSPHVLPGFSTEVKEQKKEKARG